MEENLNSENIKGVGFMLKSSQEISHVKFEIKTNISEISSVSIFKVNVVNDHISLIFIPVCQIGVSS